MIYLINTKRKAQVIENIQAEIEADTLTEALDQAHELASLDSELSCARWVINEREYIDITDIDSTLDEVLA